MVTIKAHSKPANTCSPARALTVPHSSLVMRKPAFCISKNKGSDQLHCNRAADQRLCFRFIDSTILILPKPEFQASSHLLWPYSPVCAGPGRKSQRLVLSLQDSYDNYHKFHNDMSLVVRKPAICICENKDADQLRGNREADQRLCFRYTDSTIPLLPKSEISTF